MSGKRKQPGEVPEQLDMPSVELLEAELKRVRRKNRRGRTIRTILLTLITVAAIAVVLAVLVMPVLQISGSSMENTLLDRDLVIALNSGRYKSGDVIGFYYNNEILVKRVIAVSGDWVDIDEDGTVYLNGTRLDEPYVTEKALGDCSINLPYQIPDGRLFVMGDRRESSIDSRNASVGCVSGDAVVGKLLLRIWPLDRFGLVR